MATPETPMRAHLLLLLSLTACPTAGPAIPDDTSSGEADDSSGGHHPGGWSASSVHGMAAKMQEEACLSCHGADLSGGSAGVACDDCHAPGWQTDCSYCHGVEGSDGAPPEDIDDEAQPDAISFPAHTAHGTAAGHVAYDCVECHQVPDDALSDGHFLVGDATKGVAEVDFGGLSSAGTYDGEGGCSNLYCHGNGRGTPGSVQLGANPTCHSCHGDATSGANGMSGEHAKHLGEGVTCADCHPDTAGSNTSITGAARHVDGDVQTRLPQGITLGANGCSGLCHWQLHFNEAW